MSESSFAHKPLSNFQCLVERWHRGIEGTVYNNESHTIITEKEGEYLTQIIYSSVTAVAKGHEFYIVYHLHCIYINHNILPQSNNCYTRQDTLASSPDSPPPLCFICTIVIYMYVKFG